MQSDRNCFSIFIDFLNDLNDYFASHSYTNSHKSHNYNDTTNINMMNLSENSPYEYMDTISNIIDDKISSAQHNFSHIHHTLKPRNVTFVGGKTLHSHRVSNIM